MQLKSQNQVSSLKSKDVNSIKFCMCLIALFVCLLAMASQTVEAGGKGGKGKGGMEDIILYNGNIVMRGDKKGGSIVLANQQPSHEEVEFAPSFFGFGEMGRR